MGRGEVLIGVISDTHGLLRPEAVAALQGATHIVHAGDVGNEGVLRELERIAPVTAVRGNTDYDAWAQRLPMTQLVTVDGLSIYVIHILEDLDIDPAAAGVGVVVSGHTHRPAVESRGGVLFLNPGAAGARRFHLPVTVAHLDVVNGSPRAKIVEIA